MALALTLRVGSTSAQDVSLTSSGVLVTNYPMTAPEVSQTVLASLGDGDSLSVPAWGDVTESIDVHISGSTATIVRDKVRAIERLLDLARQGTLGLLDDRAYLLAQFDQDTEAWRSQILAGKWQSDKATDQIWRNYVDGTIIITRRYFWETEALKAVAVSSGTTTTPTTGYAAVYNADTTHATHRNWFQIAADQIEGSLPAPLKISIRNDSGSAKDARAIYLGNYVFATPTAIVPVLRATDASFSDSTWTSTTEQDIYTWSLSSGNLTGCFKRQFGRVLGIFSNAPASTTLLRAAFQYSAAAVIDLALTEQVTAGSNMVVDFGALPIPPGGQWANTGANMSLSLKAKAATSGGDTAVIDWLQIMPSGAGRYRVVKAVLTSLTILAGNELVDDGTVGALYLNVVATSDALPLYRPFFEPIYGWPNKINRIAVVIQGNIANVPDTLWGVSVSVRPRRLSL